MHSHLLSASSSGRTAPDRHRHEPVFQTGLSAAEIIEKLDLKPESPHRAQLERLGGDFTLVTQFFDQNLSTSSPERAINSLVIGGTASSIFDQPRLFDITVSTRLAADVNWAESGLPKRL